jgi:hypothetical protein
LQVKNDIGVRGKDVESKLRGQGLNDIAKISNSYGSTNVNRDKRGKFLFFSCVFAFKIVFSKRRLEKAWHSLQIRRKLSTEIISQFH